MEIFEFICKFSVMFVGLFRSQDNLIKVSLLEVLVGLLIFFF